MLADERKKRFEERRKETEHMKEIVEEWGFQNEETKRMFEARFRKQKGGKKKKQPSKF